MRTPCGHHASPTIQVSLVRSCRSRDSSSVEELSWSPAMMYIKLLTSVVLSPFFPLLDAKTSLCIERQNHTSRKNTSKKSRCRCQPSSHTYKVYMWIPSVLLHLLCLLQGVLISYFRFRPVLFSIAYEVKMDKSQRQIFEQMSESEAFVCSPD